MRKNPPTLTKPSKDNPKLVALPQPISLYLTPPYSAPEQATRSLSTSHKNRTRRRATHRLTHAPKLLSSKKSPNPSTHFDGSKTILSLIGRTPLVKLKNIVPNPNVTIYAKMEGHNPGGSVKDRPALNMILQARHRNIIHPYTKLIEPTSGNTGIGLALVAGILGYSLELIMPENATGERSKMMKAFGAKVTLTPAAHEMEGAIDHARQKLQRHADPYVMLDQFSNPDNYMSHYLSTAPEIWHDTHHTVTHFVSAMGTTGTIMGISKFFQDHKKNVTIIGARPTKGSSIPGIRRWPKAYLPKIFDESHIDHIVEVSTTQAIAMTRRLALEEGIFCGTSAGGAAHIAIETAKTIDQGVVVFIVCDRGDRYLSTDLFST